MDENSDLPVYEKRRLQEALIFLKSITFDGQYIEQGSETSNEEKSSRLQEPTVNVTTKSTRHLNQSLSITTSSDVAHELRFNKSTDHAFSRSKSYLEPIHGKIHLPPPQIHTHIPTSHNSLKRITLLHNKAPLHMFSILYQQKAPYLGERKLTSIGNSNFIEDINLGDSITEVSFGHMLLPEMWRIKGIPLDMLQDYGHFEEHLHVEPEYDPCSLDDPELISGKHRTVLTLPSYMVSIIQYAKPSELKKDINERFKERFPLVTITLTKLRSLKAELVEIGKKLNLENFVIACAFVYFEKIALKTRVTKHNRKYIAGSCLLLAIKFHLDIQAKKIKDYIEEITEQFRLNSKDLIACEIQALILLEFAMLLPMHEANPMYKRLETSIV